MFFSSDLRGDLWGGGGKFSPSLANIYIAMWEQNPIFSGVNPFAPHIRWYGRYIDDLLLGGH